LNSAKLLSKVAKTMAVGTQIKNVEDEVMRERRKNRQQLKTIRGYLSGIKTGDKIRMTATRRNGQTLVEAKSIF
jgi:Cu/Ag efflux protein CusF